MRAPHLSPGVRPFNIRSCNVLHRLIISFPLVSAGLVSVFRRLIGESGIYVSMSWVGECLSVSSSMKSWLSDVRPLRSPMIRWFAFLPANFSSSFRIGFSLLFAYGEVTGGA